GINEMNCPLTMMRSSNTVYVSYPNGVDAFGNTAYSGALARVNKTVIGTGIELRTGLLYLLLSRDKYRFRIADSEIIGFIIGGNKEKRFDYTTKQRLPLPGGLYSSPWIGGSYVLAAGLKACYRINNLIDIGVSYYPLYYYIDIGASITGNTTGAYISGYGGHLRVGKIYADFMEVKLPSKQTDRWDHGPTYNVSVKYRYGSKWHFLSFNSMNQRVNTDVQNNSGLFMPQDVAAKAPVPQKWWVYQVGWGIMF
ncbi:MAG TPA: hypothetical protein VFU15_06400, partial [Bacteroidia bacterium]|nr:hypothetical protein [Bacteroidia bacterium]